MLHLLLDNHPLDATTAITEWQPVEFACLPPGDPGVAVLELAVNGQLLEPFLRPGSPAWRWRWNPQNGVGRYGLSLRAAWPDGRSVAMQAALTVVPRKLDQERYALLLDDMQQAAAAVVYALAGGAVGATLQVDGAPLERRPLTTYFQLFDERFAALEQAVTRIARRPHTHLRPTGEAIDLVQARDFTHLDGGQLRGEVYIAPDAANSIALPDRITQTRSTPSPDTYENRLLKRLLEELGRQARIIAGLANQDARRPGERAAAARAIATRCAEVTARLRTLRALPFLEAVGSLGAVRGPTTLFQRDSDYRTVYRTWQALRRAPLISVESPLFHLPIQELPRLYECWCAVQCVQALLDLPAATIREQRLVAPAGDSPAGLTFALVESEPLLTLEWRGLTLRLRYQPRYRPGGGRTERAQLVSLDRHTRVPDLALELERPGEPPEVALFDAKYRLDASGSVPEDALADAYVYLGGIGRPDGTRAACAAVLLYPGAGPPEWHPSGVGALPLLPGATGPWLEQLLDRRTA